MSTALCKRQERRLAELNEQIDRLVRSGEASGRFCELRRLNAEARVLARVVYSRPVVRECVA